MQAEEQPQEKKGAVYSQRRLELLVVEGIAHGGADKRDVFIGGGGRSAESVDLERTGWRKQELRNANGQG